MKTVRSYGNVAEAGLAQSLLRNAGIDATLVDESAAIIGLEVRLQAPEEDVERARKILDGQTGLESQPPDGSLQEPAPVENEAEVPATAKSAPIVVTCPGCGAGWELEPGEAERDEFTCEECGTTFPIPHSAKQDGIRALQVALIFALLFIGLSVAVFGYLKVGKVFPKDASAYYYRGLSRHQSGDLDGALADLNIAINLRPRFAAAYCERGIIKGAKGDPDGAIADFSQAIAIDPTAPAAYFDRAIEKRKKQDLSGAIADCNQAIDLNQNKPEYYLERGLAEGQQRDDERAVADFTQAITLDPLLSQPYEARSSVELHERNLDGAMADANKAITFDPLKPDPYYYRGNVKRDEGDFDGATIDYNKAIELDPKKPFTYLARGYVKRIKGDIEGDTADTNHAIALNPKYASAYFARGNINTLVRNWSAALADYRKCFDLSLADQDYPRFYVYLIRARLGDKEAARKELSDYMSDRKVPVGSGDWAAVIGGYLLGKVTEADLFVAAGALNPKRSKGQTCEAWYYAGMEKLLDGDTNAAPAYFQKCIETKQNTYVEFGFARSELKALGK